MHKMKHILSILFAVTMLVACGGGAAQSSSQGTATPEKITPVNYSYRIKAVYPHSVKAYTQGLEFHEGTLWEGTGQTGESRLQTIDLATGRECVVNRLPDSEFGEGITILDDKIYQLTWTDNKAYVYDLKSGAQLRTFRYAGEGWGLTNDGEKLYMSNGSANIYRLDPATFRKEATLTVTLAGEPIPLINELEWIENRIWANVYLSNAILVINPQSGVVEAVINLEGLLPEADYTEDTDVLNGIAYDPATKRILVTGKNWPKIFEIELQKQ